MYAFQHKVWNLKFLCPLYCKIRRCNSIPEIYYSHELQSFYFLDFFWNTEYSLCCCPSIETHSKVVSIPTRLLVSLVSKLNLCAVLDNISIEFIGILLVFNSAVYNTLYLNTVLHTRLLTVHFLVLILVEILLKCFGLN